jgi:hypothetical protein
MRQFYGYRDGMTAHVLTRVRGLGQAERIVAGGPGQWEDMPSLDRLAYRDPDMSWDALTTDEARAFLVEMGFPSRLLDEAVTVVD